MTSDVYHHIKWKWLLGVHQKLAELPARAAWPCACEGVERCQHSHLSSQRGSNHWGQFNELQIAMAPLLLATFRMAIICAAEQSVTHIPHTRQAWRSWQQKLETPSNVQKSVDHVILQKENDHSVEPRQDIEYVRHWACWPWLWSIFVNMSHQVPEDQHGGQTPKTCHTCHKWRIIEFQMALVIQ